MTGSTVDAVQHGTDLTTGSIPRHLVAFSVPMLLGSALQTAYSLVNAFWVGNRLGTDAMVAVTVSLPVLFVLTAVAGGLTLATTVLVSQAYGAKNYSEVRRVINNSVVLVGAISLVCVLLGQLAAAPVLRLIRTPPSALQLSVTYLRLLLFTMPPTFGIFLLAAALRGVGDSKTPLYFQAVSLAVAFVLDPLLMFGWLGFPRLGLNGTAVATLLAQTAAVVTLAYFLARGNHIASPDWLHLRADAETTWLTLKIGVPSMVQQALVSVGMMVMTGLVNTFGREGAAAFGIALRIDQLAFMPAMTIGMAVSSLVGQNVGARRFDRASAVLRWGLVMSVGMTSVASALALAVPALLLSPFSRDPHVINIGTGYLRIAAFMYLGFAIMFVSNGVINGSGHTLETTAFTLLSLWGVRIPLAAHLARSLHRIEGIWYAMLAGVAFGAALSVVYYATGLWKRPVRRHHEAPALGGTG